MFRNDYGVSCADEVLEALYKIKDEENFGYGEDYHTKRAASLIRATFGLDEDAGVFFHSLYHITKLRSMTEVLRSRI